MLRKHFRKCAICSEFFGKERIASDYSVQLFREKTESNTRMLYEDDSFIVIPSLGPVSNCHLLVLPKKHVCSFALMEPEWLDKAEKLIDKIVYAAGERYNDIVVFEHGVLNEEMEGSASCTHAHMHIVSCKYSILPDMIKDGLHLRRVSKLSDIREQKLRGMPYFYYREKGRDAFIMDDVIRTSQYMRIKAADILGTPERGNWKENPGVEDMADMFLQMRDMFWRLDNKKCNCISEPI